MRNDRLREPIYSNKRLAFREFLISKRQAIKLSQKGLANKLNVHHSMIGKIETGDRRLETLEFINYCQALNLDPCEVIKHINQQS